MKNSQYFTRLSSSLSTWSGLFFFLFSFVCFWVFFFLFLLLFYFCLVFFLFCFFFFGGEVFFNSAWICSKKIISFARHFFFQSNWLVCVECRLQREMFVVCCCCCCCCYKMSPFNTSLNSSKKSFIADRKKILDASKCVCKPNRSTLWHLIEKQITIASFKFFFIFEKWRC